MTDLISLDDAIRRNHRRQRTDRSGGTGMHAVLPIGFAMKDRGLVWSDPSDDEKPEIIVSGRFDIVAESRDDSGMSWGLVLRWEDPDGREHEWAMPRAILAGDGTGVRQAFLDGGLYVAAGQKARNLLTTFLSGVHVHCRARAVTSTGWNGTAFVLPNGTIGEPPGERVILQTATAVDHSYGIRGTLQSWQDNVAALAAGNTRLVLAISAAFAAPLIGPCGQESGGIHFRGPSSIGKTTSLRAGGSVWGGGPGGYIKQWRATSNGLESTAVIHNDLLLCLDELAQLSGREAGEIAYMLANGSGKARASRDAGLKKSARWRLLFLSSGEIALSDKIAEDARGRRQTAGQQVRVVDIPADTGSGYGLFETLNGFADADTLAKRIAFVTGEHYGTAGRAFVGLVSPDLEEVKASVLEFTRGFVDRTVPAAADGQVRRVASRFGLIAAAGEIAIRLGVVPWPKGEANNAAEECLKAWIDSRGGVEPAEVRDGIAQVRAFLSAHGLSRFLDAWAESGDGRQQELRITNLAGFRKSTPTGWEYFVTTEAWPEVTAGFDRRQLATTLVERGFLLPQSERHRAKFMRVPGQGSRRLYHIAASLMEGDADA